MAFRRGQTFLYPLHDQNRREHLWVIATEPDTEGQFAIASFTSLKGSKDQTVILRKAEHPFLKWDTCVLYALAEISNTERIQAYLDCGSAKIHQDVTPQVLRLILDGFCASDYTKNRVRDFVRTYLQAIRPKAHDPKRYPVSARSLDG